jgi:hypothetical protein
MGPKPKVIKRDTPLSMTPEPKINSDSLMRESGKKKEFAYIQRQMAKNQIKTDGGNASGFYLTTFGKPINVPSGNERMKIANRAFASASKDSAMAVKGRTKR